jgi:hypothetical protein
MSRLKKRKPQNPQNAIHPSVGIHVWYNGADGVGDRITPAGDIEVGEFVCGFGGKPSKIISTRTRTTETDMVTIKFDDGSSISTEPWHVVMMYTPDAHGAAIWSHVDDLSAGDVVASISPSSGAVSPLRVRRVTTEHLAGNSNGIEMEISPGDTVVFGNGVIGRWY